MRATEGLVGGGAQGFAEGGEVRLGRHMAPLRGSAPPAGLGQHMLPLAGDGSRIPQAVFQVPYTAEERDEAADQVTIQPAGVGQRRPVALGGRDYEGRPSPEAVDVLREGTEAAARLGWDLAVPQSPLDVALLVAAPGLGGPLTRLAARGLSRVGMGAPAARAGLAGAIAALEPSEGEAGPLRRGLGAGIRAFHGSPHEFDRFDISRINSGEGAQAYGHGLYFAENEDVARFYRDALANQRATFRGRPLRQHEGVDPASDHAFMRTYFTGYASIDDAIAEQRAEIARLVAEGDHAYAAKQRANLDRMLRLAPEIQLPRGHMYEVNLGVDAAQLLDWDAPLDRQPEAVKGIMSRFGAPQSRPRQTGQTFYNDLAAALVEHPGLWPEKAGPSAAASAVLRDAGVPGIRYLDNGSRDVGAGTSNFVMFDHEPIEIVRRYGRGGLADAVEGATMRAHEGLVGRFAEGGRVGGVGRLIARWASDMGVSPERLLREGIDARQAGHLVSRPSWDRWFEASPDVNAARTGELQVGGISGYADQVDEDYLRHLLEVGDELQAAALIGRLDAPLTLHRGMRFDSEADMMAAMPHGRATPLPGLTSYTPHEPLAEHFAGVDEVGDHIPTLLRLQAGEGLRGVDWPGANEDYAEVVLPRGSRVVHRWRTAPVADIQEWDAYIRSPHAQFGDGDVDRYAAGGLAGVPQYEGGGRVGLLQRGLGALADGIRAYHGSPHEFDRFDISRIGSGEGAQAYGHGLYFAGDEAVARHYRDALNQGSEVASSLNHFINSNAGYLRSPEEVGERLDAWARLRGAPRGVSEAAADRSVRDLVSRLVLEQAPVQFGAPVSGEVARLYGRLDDAVRQAGPRGHMYEVRLHADPEALLDWDRPLREQAGRMDQVRAALPLPRPEDFEARRLERLPSERDSWALFRRDGEGEVHLPGTYASESAARRGLDRLGRQGRDAILHPDDFTVTGEEAHRRLSAAWGAPDMAAASLLDVGVPGVRYLDAGSRRFGEGSHNFVTFDDEPVEILRRYARGGLAGALVEHYQDGGRVGLLQRGLGALLRAAEDGGAGGGRRGRRWTPPDEVIENLPLVDPVEPLRVDGEDIRQRGLAAADWMAENLVGQRIPAEGIDNREVLITAGLPGKIRTHISDPLIAGLPGIPHVIARGAPYSPPMAPETREQGVLRYHYLGARVPVGEQVDPWRVVVREETDGRLLTHDAGSLGRVRRPRAAGERVPEEPLSDPASQGRGQRAADDVTAGEVFNPGSGDDLDEAWSGYASGGMAPRGHEGLVRRASPLRRFAGGGMAGPLSGQPGPQDELATTQGATQRGLAQASAMWAQAGNVLRTGGLGAMAPVG